MPYKIKLKDRKELADRTMAFFFEKPASFQFKAGQFIRMTLIDPPETDAEGAVRNFTVASAPYEDDLMIATRLRDSAFKRILAKASLGTEVTIAGPFGAFVLHEDSSRPAAFLTGGIGITPFRSILLQALKEKRPHRFFLFYSNRRPEDAAFLEELRLMEKENKNYQFIPTMTGMEKSRQTWQGETGHMDQQMLATHIHAGANPLYYIAGPPGMVNALRGLLAGTGVAKADIRYEEFPGY